jgi:hypothetical protein
MNLSSVTSHHLETKFQAVQNEIIFCFLEIFSYFTVYKELLYT